VFAGFACYHGDGESCCDFVCGIKIIPPLFEFLQTLALVSLKAIKFQIFVVSDSLQLTTEKSASILIEVTFCF
jgi:hypothetical protein